MPDNQVPIAPNTPFEDALNQSNFGKFGSGMDALASTQNDVRTTAQLSPADINNALLQHAAEVNKGTAKPNPLNPTTVPASLVDTSGRYNRQIIGADNEDLYGQMQSNWDKAANGLIKTLQLTTSTFLQGTVGLVAGLQQVITGHGLSSLYNNNVNQGLQSWNDATENQLPNYYTKKEADAKWYSPSNWFTANFLFDKLIKNAGFSLGAIGAGWATGAAIKGLTSLLPLFGTGEAAATVGALEDALSAVPAESRWPVMQNIIRNAQTNFAGKGWNFLAEAPNSPTVQRALISTLGASTEGGIEALQGLNEWRNNKIKEYTDTHGFAPQGQDLQKIDSTASDLGNARFGMNMALLTATNYIMLPKILGSKYTTSRAIANTEAAALGETAAVRKTATGVFERALPTTKSGRALFKAGNVANLLFSPTEAFEEGAQYGIQKGVEDYYNKAYKGEGRNWLDSTASAISSVYNDKEGMESILLGGVSGGLQQIRENYKERGFAGLGGRQAKATEAFLSDVNDNLKPFPTKEGNTWFSDMGKAVARGINLMHEGEAYIRQGDVLEAKDNEADQMHNYLAARIKWGRYDLVKDDIAHMLQQGGTEHGLAELKSQGYANDNDTTMSFTQRVNNFAAHAENIDNLYKHLNLTYAGVFTTENGEKQRKYSEEVIDKMVYAGSKIADYDTRIPQLSEKLAAYAIDINTPVSEIMKTGKPDEASTREALDSINNLQTDVNGKTITSDDKDELKSNLRDIIELALRRKEYVKEYEDIKRRPGAYKEATLPARQEVVSVPQSGVDKEGKPTIVQQDLQLGKTYSLDETIHRDGAKLFLAPKITPINATLGGEIETVLPSGEKSFVPKEAFKNMRASEIDNANKDTDKAFTEAVANVADRERWKTTLGDSFTSLEDKTNPQQVQNYVNNLNNGEFTSAILDQMKPQLEKIQKERAEQIKREQAIKQNAALQKAINTAMDNSGTPTQENLYGDGDSFDFMKDLSIIAATGTEQRWEAENPQYNNAHRRHQEFLLNFSRPEMAKGLKDLDIRIIPVTSKTEKALGLEGIIDPAFKANSIRYVYVAQKKGSTEWTYVDKEGKALSKVGEKADLNNVIFTNAPEADLSWGTPREKSYTNKNGTDEKEMLTRWAAQRERFFSAETAEQALSAKMDFSISRGIPNVTNINTQNSILSIKLIDEKDLDAPLIQVPTFGNTAINDANVEVEMPLGKPLFNYRGNLFFLNNRKLTNAEAKNIVALLQKALAGEEIEKVMPYIKDVLFLSNKLQEGKVSPNQVFFDAGFSLNIGGTTFPLDDLIKGSPAIVEALEKVYHNVNNKSLLAFSKNPQNTPFHELSVKDGKIESKEWKSYQHYLFQAGNIPPVTTNIIHPGENEVPIIQKYPILDIANLQAKTENIVPTSSDGPIKVTVVETTNQHVDAQVEKFTFTKQTNGATKLEGTYVTKKGVEIPILGVVSKEGKIGLMKGSAEVKALPEFELLMKTLIEAANEPIQEKGAVLQKTVPYTGEKTGEEIKTSTESDPFGASGNFDNKALRRADTPFTFSGDKEKEFAEVQRMLPNLNVEILRNIIETTGGLKAWGYALPHFAYVWEEAPYGTLYHEAFEQVYNWILPLEGQAKLYNEFIKRDGTFSTYDGRTIKYSDASEAEAKEQLADEFGEFKTSGRILTPTKEKVGFFRKLLDFLKTLFTNPQAFWNVTSEVEKVFRAIDAKNYASAPVRNDVNTKPEYKRAVTGMAESLVQDTISGMAAELFMKKWQDDVSLIAELEENPEVATKKLFEQLKDGLENYFMGKEGNVLLNYMASQIRPDQSNRVELAKLYREVQANWGKVKGQWGNFMEDLKSFLKVFDTAFTIDDEGNIALAENDIDNKEERPQQEYASEDKLFINAKNSASQIVKLLFATVADSHFVYSQIKNDITGNLEKIFKGNEFNREANQMRLVNLAPYAKLFNYTLHNSANTNGIYSIFDKLRTQSKRKDIRVNANLEILLNRMKFDDGFNNMDKASAKLILKVENALTKQKPEFFRQYLREGGEMHDLASNLSDRVNTLSQEWINQIKDSKFTSVVNNEVKFKKGMVPENNDTYLFLDNLGIKITKEDYNSLPNTDANPVKNRFNTAIAALKAGVIEYNKKGLPYITTSNTVGFGGRLTELAKIYAEYVEGVSTESQHFNIDEKPTSNFILNNYMSFIFNGLNDVKVGVGTLDEFKAKNPQFNDVYMGNSHYLNNVLFKDGVRTAVKFAVSIVEGRTGVSSNPTSKMTYGERVINEVNNNLNGKFHVSSADSKTEWGARMANVLERKFFRGQRDEQLNSYVDKMFNSLMNEIALAKDYDNRKNIEALNQLEDGRPVGKSLRFFKNLLSKDVVNRIHQKIDNNEEFTQEQSDSLRTLFRTQLLDYISKRAQSTINTLTGFKLIERSGKDRYKVYGIDSDFVRTEFGKKNRRAEYDAATLNNLFFFREANYIFANMEMHKLLFNDPAQYKDELKRIKSFMSGREYTHVSTDDTNSLNPALDRLLNVQNGVPIRPSDFGYITHSNTFNSLTVNDVKTTAPQEIVDRYKKYNSNDIADAQSWMHPLKYREWLYKAGGRFTVAQDNLHEWMMAYQRQAYLKKGRIAEDRYSKELQAADLQTLKKPIPETRMDILKPIISGVRNVNGVAQQYLYKTSTASMYYYFVEGTQLEDTLWEMEKNGVHFLAMSSAHKVGKTTENSTDFFDEEGKANDFSKASTTPIEFKYAGIQVETGGEKKNTTQGSQTTKIAVSNLMSNGKAVRPEYEDIIKRHNEVLSNLAIKRSQRVFDTLGIQKGEFGYTYADKKLVSDFILNELTRRRLPFNMGEGIETNEDGEFRSPLEANVNYKKIKEILWSTIENNITRPKTTGKSSIMLSALGWNGIKKEIVNGKTVYTSSKLKFYSTKDGKTQACQIALPYHFGNKVLELVQKRNGVKFENPKEGYEAIRQYLNNTKEGRELLQGIGFRIPTQGLNSIDYFEIAEFLPPQMGDAVIFPAEIVTKAGSDFDIDKMNMYLKSFYIGADGYPKAIPFFSYDEAENKKELKSLLNEEAMIDILRNHAPADDTAFDDVKWENEALKAEDALDRMHIKSLENEYYRVLQDILTLPENLDRLIKPNDADQLKAISREIQDLKGEKQDVPTDYTRLIDSSYMSGMRQVFLAMKNAVGIAAVSNINLIINQLSQYNISASDKVAIDRNFAVRFKHNLEGNMMSLAFDKNAFGDFLSDLGSQVIDGAVDATKSDWLARMIGDESALNVMLLMYKAGISPRTTAYFLNQPIIQDFLKERGISQNLVGINPKIQKRSDKDLQLDVSKAYGLGGWWNFERVRKNKPAIYEDAALKSNIGKTSKQFTNKGKDLQIGMLDDFLVFNSLAWKLFASIQGYNWDTSRYTSPEAVDRKKLQWQKAEVQMNTTSVNHLLNSSHLKVLKNSVLDVNQALASLFNTHKGVPKQMLNEMAVQFSSMGMTRDSFVKYLQKAEGSMIDFITQTQVDYNGIQLNKMNRYFFQSQFNTARWVKVMQGVVKNNPILDNLEAVNDPFGQLSYLRIKEQDYDTYTSNVWTAAFKELRDNGTPITITSQDAAGKEVKTTKTVSQIFNHILVSQILQNGSTRKRDSFLHLIPNEDYAKLVAPHLKDITANIEYWKNNDLFFRNNWNDSTLVPESPKETRIPGEEKDEYIPSDYFPAEARSALFEIGHKAPYFITLPAFTWKSKPFIKNTILTKNEAGRVINSHTQLFKRVDGEDEYGNKAPYSARMMVLKGEQEQDEKIKYGRFVVYKQVSKLGEDNLKEYYDDKTDSILNRNPHIEEIPDEQIINALRLNDANKLQVEWITSLISDSEYEEGPESPQPEAVPEEEQTSPIGPEETKEEAPTEPVAQAEIPPVVQPKVVEPTPVTDEDEETPIPQAILQKAADQYLKEWLEDNPRYYDPNQKEDEDAETDIKKLTRITPENVNDARRLEKKFGDVIVDKRGNIQSVINPSTDYIEFDMSNSTSSEFKGFNKLYEEFIEENDREYQQGLAKFAQKYGIDLQTIAEDNDDYAKVVEWNTTRDELEEELGMETTNRLLSGSGFETNFTSVDIWNRMNERDMTFEQKDAVEEFIDKKDSESKPSKRQQDLFEEFKNQLESINCKPK